jgi:mannose-6-phosphate isomerase-like protein (cupin superfamily)
MPADYKAISIADKFKKFSEVFQPKVIASMNDYEFKLARVKGDFVWHSHADTDETFLVIDGEMIIEFRDGKVNLRSGDIFIVPRGKEHKPFAAKECKIMLIEPAGTVNTGEAGGDLTAPNDAWI